MYFIMKDMLIIKTRLQCILPKAMFGAITVPHFLIIQQHTVLWQRFAISVKLTNICKMLYKTKALEVLIATFAIFNHMTIHAIAPVASISSIVALAMYLNSGQEFFRTNLLEKGISWQIDLWMTINRLVSFQKADHYTLPSCQVAAWFVVALQNT